MWRAYFRDGFVVHQYREDGEERGFNHVLDRHDKLEKLTVDLSNGDVFAVDITKGLFTVTKNNQSRIHFYGLPQDTCAQETLSNVRIIYFSRESVQMALNNIAGSHAAHVHFFALGFQANLSNGKNIQRYLAIYPDGTFDIRGEDF